MEGRIYIWPKAKYFIFIIIILLIVSFDKIIADDLRTIVNLTGYWKFSVGDNLNWAKTSYNDKDWDRVYAPKKWEDEGYYALDGYAWYRKKFDISKFYNENIIFLKIDKIDDSDQVFINGVLIGQTGGFPPDYYTGVHYKRYYIIPNEHLNFDGSNTIAIRVFDEGGQGGITKGSIKLCIDEDYDLVDLNLAGEWKFHLHTNNKWAGESYDDSNWDKIKVPMNWESQGYIDHDGYAWYRKTFFVKDDLLFDEDLYIFLGKIDDQDRIYINGSLVGTVYDLKNDSYSNRNKAFHRIERIYQIPEGLLRAGKNTIAIRVYDGQGLGGIYEGPVGIMKKENYYRYMNKHRYDKTIWEEIIEMFWD